MSFLIDTDTCSAHLKGNPQVTNRFLQYTGRLHISTVTLGELYTWALRAKASPKRLQDLVTFLSDVYVLDVTADEARRFGEIRANLLDQGLPAPDMDLLIAATALVYGLTLVTHNMSDYANVPGLSLVDWMVPRTRGVRAAAGGRIGIESRAKLMSWPSAATLTATAITKEPSTMRKTTDALKIIDRMIGDDAELRQMITEESLNAAVARMVYEARTNAGLTQRQLGNLVGTKQPVIARLEDADYEGHSLSMLNRIAAALNQRLVVRMTPAGGKAAVKRRKRQAS